MRNQKLIIAAAGLLAMLISSCQKQEEILTSTKEESVQLKTTESASTVQASNYVPNELIVKFKKGLSGEVKNKILARINANISEKILTKTMQRFGDNEGIVVIHMPLAVLEALGKIKRAAEIEYAEPNYIYQHDVLSNDPYFTNSSLWGMYGDATSPVNQYGCQAGEAWAAGHTGSSSVYIGVIDEGAMYAHSDLAANFWTNPFDPVDGVDNDGNGYKDDIHGWDFDKNDNTTFDGTQDDHGTHVSGTIGAVGGNGIGVAGVNWKVKIISAKFLGRRGGTTANAIKAVDYITDLKTRHSLNIPATNNSWGGGGFSQGLKDAIDRANAANILFVAAAGNDGASNDLTLRYPSSYTSANIIAVASITSSGALSSFSNYGVNTVDIGAPGSGIYSTLPSNVGTSSYGSYSGTSMATPHVTGGVALYAASHPGVSAATIKAAILNSAVPTSSLSGKCVTGGRLNVSGF
ncbi:S8 family peptidase [Solitalea lacus]|uniref:S8 family peptidase n=1 Tax=Solitalea lacus TaxID=2911172 RepID=UPI001EDC836D|nr:S8 family peptidase [Solitalea lacus]UKJ09127.1 S8 family serine peptidase [Solitalea lacus]